jgi:hypothetical protein
MLSNMHPKDLLIYSLIKQLESCDSVPLHYYQPSPRQNQLSRSLISKVRTVRPPVFCPLVSMIQTVRPQKVSTQKYSDYVTLRLQYAMVPDLTSSPGFHLDILSHITQHPTCFTGVCDISSKFLLSQSGSKCHKSPRRLTWSERFWVVCILLRS